MNHCRRPETAHPRTWRLVLPGSGALLLAAVSGFLLACASSGSSPSLPTPSLSGGEGAGTSGAAPTSVSPVVTPGQPGDTDKPTKDSGRGGEPVAGGDEKEGDAKDASKEMVSGAAETAGKDPAGSERSGSMPSGGAQTPEEQRVVLDRKLEESLAEFDRLLQDEQEKLARAATEAAVTGGGGARGGVGGSGGELGSGGSASGSSDGGDDASGDSPDFSPEEDPVRRVEGAAEGAEKDGVRKTRESRTPADVGDGSDDDIVARQLREAAEAEEDPELREKLWDEYRAYKRGTLRKPSEKTKESKDD